MKHARNTTVRPWGKYILLEKKRGYWIKKLFVRQGASISLQSHQDRSEIWVVLSGSVVARKGNTRYTLTEGKALRIEVQETHRITGLEDSWILEAAFGHPRETDITRFEDDYGRVK